MFLCGILLDLKTCCHLILIELIKRKKKIKKGKPPNIYQGINNLALLDVRGQTLNVENQIDHFFN